MVSYQPLPPDSILEYWGTFFTHVILRLCQWSKRPGEADKNMPMDHWVSCDVKTKMVLNCAKEEGTQWVWQRLEGEEVTWVKSACFNSRFANYFLQRTRWATLPEGQQLYVLHPTFVRLELFKRKQILLVLFFWRAIVRSIVTELSIHPHMLRNFFHTHIL